MKFQKRNNSVKVFVYEKNSDIRKNDNLEEKHIDMYINENRIKRIVINKIKKIVSGLLCRILLKIGFVIFNLILEEGD